jgi:PleD family two-component response regulator
VIDIFTKRYQNESDFLMGWRQTKARITRQIERKRYAINLEKRKERL